MIRDKIEGVIKEALGEAKIPFESAEVRLQHPADARHGDYATNVAFLLAPKVKRAPHKLADELLPLLRQKINKDEDFAKVEVAGGGFINFFLSPTFYLDELRRLLGDPPSYAKNSLGRGQKVVLEHTNINPNKAAHVGHLRNACIGQSLERLLKACGFNVEVQYYVNDVGAQVAPILLGLRHTQRRESDYAKFDHFAWDVYAEINAKLAQDPKLHGELGQILRELEDRESETSQKGKKLAERILADQLMSMQALGIDYDLLIWEGEILYFKLWEAAQKMLATSPKYYQVKEGGGPQQGCWVLHFAELPKGDEEHQSEKIIVRSDGTVTYTGKDIAYHLWKYNLLKGRDFLYAPAQSRLGLKTQVKPWWTTAAQGKASKSFGRADWVVNVIDARQSYLQEVLRLALRELGFAEQAARFRHVNYGFVYMSRETAVQLGVAIEEGRSQYPMSGREGLGVKIDDLLDLVKARLQKERGEFGSLDEVAVGAIKYAFLRQDEYEDFTFDYQKALDFYGETGPYLQYTHVRCCSVQEKAQAAGKGERAKEEFKSSLRLDRGRSVTDLLATLARFPEAVEEVAQQFKPHLLARYLYELATKYNSFYEKERILGSDQEELYLAVNTGVCEVMRQGLFLLGIPAPQKM